VLLVDMYIKGTKERVPSIRNAITPNREAIRATFGQSFKVDPYTVIIAPRFITGLDVEALSVGLPDVLFKIMHFGETVSPPFADQLQSALLRNCNGLDMISFKIGIHGRDDSYANSTYRPK